MDGLKGLPEAIKVYKTPNKEAASDAPHSLEATWGDKYPIVIQSRTNNWDSLSICFNFPSEIIRD